MFQLHARQAEAVAANGSVLLYGAAGTGKSVALQHRLLRLLAEGAAAYNILTLVNEYGQEQPFLELIQQSGLGPYSELHITTYNSLAREMVVLFWPLVARDAGFAVPHLPPTFLEYDLAQLLMWRILRPLQEGGAFASLRLRPQRIVSQLLDILNRAAFNGLTLEEAIARQSLVWGHEQDRLKQLNEAAEAARLFRAFCLERSLLDFSLTIEVFDRHLVRHPQFNRYFAERYRHVLVDNIEEQTAAGQRFVRAFMRRGESVAVVYDEGGGYRRFLSADPAGAAAFQAASQTVVTFTDSFTSTAPLQHLGNRAESFLRAQRAGIAPRAAESIWGVVKTRYRREMLQALPERLLALMKEQAIPPSQVAIIAPYLDGALQYSLRQELAQAGIPYRLLRRRSSPREEPRVRAWLTWLALAHPDWGMPPSEYDVAEAFSLSLPALDPVRAALLARALYHAPSGSLADPDGLDAALAERLGEASLERLAALRHWLAENGGKLPPDEFLFHLFNDLLAQPYFQAEPDLAGAAVCDWLVRTAGSIRRAAPAIGLQTDAAVGQALIAGIRQGLVTANPPDLGDPPDPDGVVIATVYSYLLSGLHSQVQVWLEVGIMGWWQTPYQPLSNAFVMVPSRPAEQPWTAQEEQAVRNELLAHVIRGLTNRCSGGVILAFSDLDRAGQRQIGPLWRALQPISQLGT